MPGSQSDFGQRLGAVVVAHSRAHQGLCRAPGDALDCWTGGGSALGGAAANDRRLRLGCLQHLRRHYLRMPSVYPGRRATSPNLR